MNEHLCPAPSPCPRLTLPPSRAAAGRMELVAEDLAVPEGGSAEEQLVAQQKMTNLLLNTIAVQVPPTAAGALSFLVSQALRCLELRCCLVCGVLSATRAVSLTVRRCLSLAERGDVPAPAGGERVGGPLGGAVRGAVQVVQGELDVTPANGYHQSALTPLCVFAQSFVGQSEKKPLHARR